MKSAALLAAAVLSPTALASYSLVQEFQGANFFDGWVFYGNYDNTTDGDVTYLNKSAATADKLAYVTSGGQAVIKVDNTSDVVYNDKRDSVRITTADYYPAGSVILFDATHLPYGCSVWPGFWTKGENWPEGGEIDIVEGINGMTANQMALHSENGCSASSSATASGSIGTTNCSEAAGCTYTETKANSYGAGFAAAGGGVWATLFASTGIEIWFWSRSDIPSSISNATTSISTDDWGTPSASYPASSCDIETYFKPQQIVLDITLCGDWAGLDTIYPETCPISGGGAANASSCYLQNVINQGNQTALATAYFEINYLKVFNSNETLVTSGGASSSVAAASATSEASASASTSSTSNSSSSGAGTVRVWGVGVSVTLVALSAWMLL
ncbi:glycoside hydrolase family 16 protein [Wolfiporia cocos MD-104 SS10]|uniref:Glycoside hydrolase family 16 protein n=1 Tax=Wolfiporia cocos (strain MD-104) TaxID=742152 RepID=A0A2H3K2D7_WOLCO|nr:glycoside hydrolase family 16 protein [Wolfiporia cocos MD-104 SS10]